MKREATQKINPKKNLTLSSPSPEKGAAPPILGDFSLLLARKAWLPEPKQSRSSHLQPSPPSSQAPLS